MNNFEDELDKLFKLTNSNNTKGLSEALEVSTSTVRSWRTRKSIPADVQRKAELIKMNLATSSCKTSKEALKNHLMEGLFRAVQVKGITLADDVRIGSIANILIEEIESSDPNFFIKPSESTG